MDLRNATGGSTPFGRGVSTVPGIAASDSGMNTEFVGFDLGGVSILMKRAPFFSAVHRPASDTARTPGSAASADGAVAVAMAAGGADTFATDDPATADPAAGTPATRAGTAPDARDGSGALIGPYFDTTMRFGDGYVAMVRLDDLLCDLFGIESLTGTALRAGLVARVDAFGTKTATCLSGIIAERFPGLDTGLIAFGISGNGAMQPVRLSSLRPMPRTIRRFLWRQGIVACRFAAVGDADALHPQDRIELLVDPIDISFPGLCPPEVNA